MLRLDHLTVIAPTLAEGVAHVRACLDLDVPFGQHHRYMGTHNHLLQLGDGVYLEIVALDPEGEAPGRARWFGLDDAGLRARIGERPRLIHWVARCEDIVSASAACPEPPGEILDLARGDFRWRITVPVDGHLPGDGLIPSLIQWLSPAHPADKLPDCGCGLMKLEGFHPEPKRIRGSLSALGLDKALALFPAEAGEMPGLAAYLRTPRGLREID
jgi:hypothetical protein